MRTFSVVSLCLACACAHQVIEGTQVPDTEDNRELVAALETVRQGMQERDVARVLSVVSAEYYEDFGNADPADDFGYTELRDTFLPDSLSVAEEMHLTFEIHEVVVEGERAWADIRYRSRAKMALGERTRWDTHREFNRVEFTREEDVWRIISGL